MNEPHRPARRPTPGGPEGPSGEGRSPPRDRNATPNGDAPRPTPRILFEDASTDVPAMIAMSSRIALMADAIRSVGTVPDGHDARVTRDADSRLENPPTRVHVSHVEDGRRPFLLVYDLVGTPAGYAPIRMRIHLPPSTPAIPAVRAEAAVHAARIERIVDGIGKAIAEASRIPGEHAGPSIGHVVAERIQWDFPDRLHPFAGSVRTTTFVDGAAEVEYDPRFRGLHAPTPILKPPAMNALTAHAVPLATIVESRIDGIRCYDVEAVTGTSPVPEPSDDPVERLRRLSAIRTLGDDVYTDAFLTLRKALRP